MNIRLIPIAVATMAALLTTQQASAASCKDIQLNPSLTEEYPNIRDNCLEVITHEGREYMKQEARVMSVHRDGRVGLRFKRADGSMGKTVELQAPENFHVLMDGKPRRVSALSRGDTVQIYLLGRDANYYAANEATGAPISTLPAAATYDLEIEPEATLATTASPLPLFGLLGGIFLFLGGMFTVARWRR